jgi:hypothetical protein
MARKAAYLRFRLTAEDLAAFKAAAEREGIPLSDWMRRAANREVRLADALEAERELEERQAARIRASSAS